MKESEPAARIRPKSPPPVEATRSATESPIGSSGPDMNATSTTAPTSSVVPRSGSISSIANAPSTAVASATARRSPIASAMRPAIGAETSRAACVIPKVMPSAAASSPRSARNSAMNGRLIPGPANRAA